MTSLQTLRGFASLQSFTDAELEVLRSAAIERHFAEDEVICREGSPGTSAYLCVEGRLEVLRGLGETTRLLTRVRPGSLIGQIALVDRGPRSATIRAEVASVVLELSRDVFEKLLRAQSPLALRFQETIAVSGIRQARAAVERLGAILAKPVPAAPEPKRDETLEYIQTAATEWGLSLDQMDEFTFVDQGPPKSVAPRV